VVPVKLDQKARIPPLFDQMQHLNLTFSDEAGYYRVAR